MALESLTLDPAAVSSNTPLLLQDPANGLTVLSVDFPAPDRTTLYASSMDTEGGDPVAAKYENRTIPIVVRAFDVSPGDGKMAANVKKLQQKVGRIADPRETGYLGRVDSGSAGTIYFELTDAKVKVPSDNIYAIKKSALCELELTARPLGFGTEQTLSDHPETVLPVLNFTEAAIPGDVPALGRLVIDNDQAGQDQLWLQWGVRSKNYGTATSNALKYEAETRLPQGGAILAARSGASGGTVVRQGTLTTTYQSMMSLASSGTAFPSHVGNYKLMGRVYDPGGTAGVTVGGTQGNVTLALEWAQGDFVQITRNDPVSPAVINDYSIVDFGQVNLTKAVSGTQRWDGRIIAKGTDANQSVDVDYVWFVPVDEGSGQAQGLIAYQSPSVFLARDEFNQAAGTATGKTLPVGGVWQGAGDPDDFSLDTTNRWIQRTAVSDTGGAINSGRFLTPSGVTAGTIVAQVDFGCSINTNVQMWQGLVARYTDANNCLLCLHRAASPTQSEILLCYYNAAVFKTVKALFFSLFAASSTPNYRMRLVVDPSSRIFVYFGLVTTDPPPLVMTAQDSNLPASGKVGILDSSSIGTACTRVYDNFLAFTPTADAAVFAQQSLELRSDRVRREDSLGAVWAPLSKYEGSYLLVPPSGQEARTSEFIIKASRNDPLTMGDPGIDDLSAQLFIQPRYLNVPES